MFLKFWKPKPMDAWRIKQQHQQQKDKKHLHMTEILLRKLLHVFIAVSHDFPTVRTNPIITVCIYCCLLLNFMKCCCQPRTRDREFCGGREIPGPLPRLMICRTTLLHSKEKSFISKIFSTCSSLFTSYLYEMLNELWLTPKHIQLSLLSIKRKIDLGCDSKLFTGVGNNWSCVVRTGLLGGSLDIYIFRKEQIWSTCSLLLPFRASLISQLYNNRLLRPIP